MTDTVAFVAELARQDIKLWLDGDTLRINAPTGGLSPALVARLKERKPEVVAFLREHQAAARVTTIVPGPRPERLPLSFAQQRLWFLAQLEGASDTYNIAAALRLHGPLDVEAFATSWRQIEARHEVLRTSFPQLAGQAHQQINLPGFTLNRVDLSALPQDEQADAVARLAHDEAGTTFDLASGPLWRVTLARLSEQEHALFVTMHHIISDGWSIGIITRELSALYAQQRGQQAEALPQLPLQYADVALWQRKWLEGAVLQEQLAYWRRQLADAPPFLPLPVDHPRPPVQRHQGDQIAVTLAQPLTRALGRLAQANDATLFMVLQAAFATLLARYTGQEEFCVGTPIANRQFAEVEPLVGFFVNTLVLRNDLTGNPSFRELLARVRQLTLDAYQHQAVPFELVVEALQPERNLAYSPLFQVMFVLQNNRQETLALGELAFSPLDVEHPVAKFDLTLTVWEGSGELTAAWNYNTDLFERSTIERMAGHYKTLLGEIAADPGQAIARLPMLSAAERHQLLVTWNDTAADYPAELCLHQLFEAQVERTPNAPAVAYEGQALTYAELNWRANQLAHRLQQCGVGPEVLVGLCVERSPAMMVGLLGILKAGGAYLPLDSNYPAERLAAMREDARVKLLVIQAGLRAQLGLEAEQVIELEDLAPTLSTANPQVAVRPTNLAYVIYTSGSTGQPKGVQITHQGVVNYLHWCVRTYPVSAGNGIPVNGSFSFDGTLPALFAPLLVGKQVSLLPEERQFDLLSGALREAEEPFSLIKGTPTHLNLLHRLIGQPRATLRTHALVLGGEAVPRSLVDLWWQHAPGSRVFNQYGPTEATVACCWYEVLPHTTLPEIVPIGRPIANTQLYLLDRYRQLVPIGVPGELYVGGVQVARGYLNRPELTAERFIQNPFGPGRLYKTGDLCRYLPDGTLEFLGRIDDQVKLHGFRIEPGEIEAQLRQCAGVQAALVMVRETTSGKRLVAYVVGAVAVEELRARLSQKLPPYMVPAQFIQLPDFPVLPNGKINRRALPAPDETIDTARRVAPRTPTETLLASIWRDILGIEQVGVTDNFFQVGGDSILSIQIVSRAREAGLHLTPKDLFQHQTIADLAGVARSAPQTRAEQGIVTGALPLTPIQRRFFAQGWSEPHHYNQSMLLELVAEVQTIWLKAAVRSLFTHHDALRSRFKRTGAGWQQTVIAPALELPFTIVDLSPLGEHEQQAALAAQADALQASLNLEQGPLLRVAFFQLGARKLLLIVIHHLVVDGVSWRILLEDLQTAYQQAASGSPLKLPAKTTSFKAWATLVQAQGPQAVADERDYWRQICAIRTQTLPTDQKVGPNDHASAAVVSTRLGTLQTAALLNEASAAYHTQINDLLLTALLLAYHRWSGQTTLLLDLEGHGREELFSDQAIDLSRTVGWFTTVFPVVLELTTAEPGAAIKQVKEQLRHIPRRGIGYGLLRFIHDDQALAASAEISFNYLGQFDQSIQGSLITAFANDTVGSTRSPAGPRARLLEISAIVMDGQLQIDWVYSRNVHDAGTIQRFAHAFDDALQELVAHCQAPGVGGYTPSDFPDISLSQAQLDALLGEIARANHATGSINQRNEAIYPLSPSQQGMLVETLAFPGSGVHIEQSVLSWHGPFDGKAFAQAWRQVLERHTTLRTGFAWENLAEPLQFVLRGAQLPIAHHSLRGLVPEVQQQHIERYLAADRQRGFSPSQPPLMRLALFEVDDSLCHLVWTRHHLLSDGWSLPIMMRELMALYEAECSGQPLHLPPSRPYRNYIAWLRKQDLAASEAFWRTYLAGFTTPTPLSTRLTEVTEGARHASAELVVPAATTATLVALGRQHGFTASTLIQGAWALLLHHHSGARDLLFGATVAGRPPEVVEAETMVGLFINTVPVRVRLPSSPDIALLSWLQALQAQGLEQQPHTYCSSGQIHQWSEVPGSLPLYESLLVFENYPTAVAPTEGATPRLTPFPLSGERATGAQTRYALTALVLPGAELAFRFVYDTQRLTAADIERLQTRLLALLEQVAADPLQPLSRYLLDIEQAPTLRLAPPIAARSGLALPRTEAEQQLVRIWQDVLGIETVGVRDSFFDLGGHSLVALRLMAQLQQQFDRNLPLATLFLYPTIEQLAQQLGMPAESPGEAWPTLVPIQPDGESLPFFCVPGAGGNPLYLYDLASCLGKNQPFYGLQAIGLDGETRPYTSVEAIAAHNIEAIQRVQPQGPYLLGGHSFGGKVAFEMAQQLCRAGHEVAGVLLLDVAAPTLQPEQAPPEWDEARWLVALAGAFGTIAGRQSVLVAEELRALAPEEQLVYFKVELERLGLLPEGSSLSQARGWVEVFKCNQQTTYAPGPVTPVPLTLFRAEAALAHVPDSDHRVGRPDDPTLGWAAFTATQVEVVPVPGDHLTMMSRPHVEALALRLREHLQRIKKRVPHAITD
nr:non-ribosomal peptide synthetase [Candidatus Chloroploca sp. Khr17]